MNDFIAMEESQCQICGVVHQHNTGILIDKRMRDIKNTVTGLGLCEEHDDLYKQGMIAFIEADNAESEKLKFQDANRTGRVLWINLEDVRGLLDENFPDGMELAFVTVQGFDAISDLYDSVHKVGEDQEARQLLN
jgi:hypothetical protein